MKKIRPYYQFINESYASVFKKLGSEYIKRYKDTLLSFFQLGKTNDENVQQISYEDVQKKKYYDPKYVILACGNKQEYADSFDYNKPEGPDNPRYVSHYAIKYIFRGTDVEIIEGYGKKNEVSRKKVTTKYMDYYAIDTTGMESINTLRNQRLNIKNNAWIKDDIDEVTGKIRDTKDRKGLNRYEKEQNRQRYLEAKKKKLNIDDVFKTISEKMDKFNEYFKVKCEYVRLKTKHNETVDEQLIRNMSKTWPNSRKIAKELESHNIYVSNEHIQNPIELLDSLMKQLNHIKSNSGSHYGYGKIDLIKNALNKLTVPDTGEMLNEISKLKWLDSDKLTKLDKSLGLMENV